MCQYFHEAGSATATVTVKVEDRTAWTMSHFLGNKEHSLTLPATHCFRLLITVRLLTQQDPSTIDTAPVVSDATITDADANGEGGPSKLSVSFTFNELMDTNTIRR